MPSNNVVKGYKQKTETALSDLLTVVAKCPEDSIFEPFDPLELCVDCYAVFKETHETVESTFTVVP